MTKFKKWVGVILTIGSISLVSGIGLAQEQFTILPMDQLWRESGMFGESFSESELKGLPRSGCRLLYDVLHTCVKCDDPRAILQTIRNQEEWFAYFKSDRGSAYVHMTEEALTDMDQDSFNEYADKGALAEMDWKQVSTLVSYLNINLPVRDGKMPRGGCTLLLEVLENCDDCRDDLQTILRTKRTPEEWGAYFQDRGAMKNLTEKEITTLVVYLAINLPMEEIYIPKDPGQMKCFDLPYECQ